MNAIVRALAMPLPMWGRPLDQSGLDPITNKMINDNNRLIMQTIEDAASHVPGIPTPRELEHAADTAELKYQNALKNRHRQAGQQRTHGAGVSSRSTGAQPAAPYSQQTTTSVAAPVYQTLPETAYTAPPPPKTQAMLKLERESAQRKRESALQKAQWQLEDLHRATEARTSATFTAKLDQTKVALNKIPAFSDLSLMALAGQQHDTMDKVLEQTQINFRNMNQATSRDYYFVAFKAQGKIDGQELKGVFSMGGTAAQLMAAVQTGLLTAKALEKSGIKPDQVPGLKESLHQENPPLEDFQEVQKKTGMREDPMGDPQSSARKPIEGFKTRLPGVPTPKLEGIEGVNSPAINNIPNPATPVSAPNLSPSVMKAQTENHQDRIEGEMVEEIDKYLWKPLLGGSTTVKMGNQTSDSVEVLTNNPAGNDTITLTTVPGFSGNPQRQVLQSEGTKRGIETVLSTDGTAVEKVTVLNRNTGTIGTSTNPDVIAAALAPINIMRRMAGQPKLLGPGQAGTVNASVSIPSTVVSAPTTSSAANPAIGEVITKDFNKQLQGASGSDITSQGSDIVVQKDGEMRIDYWKAGELGETQKIRNDGSKRIIELDVSKDGTVTKLTQYHANVRNVSPQVSHNPQQIQTLVDLLNPIRRQADLPVLQAPSTNGLSSQVLKSQITTDVAPANKATYTTPKAITDKLGIPESNMGTLGKVEDFIPDRFDRSDHAEESITPIGEFERIIYIQPTTMSDGQPVIEIMNHGVIEALTVTTSTQEVLDTKLPAFRIKLDEPVDLEKLSSVLATGDTKCRPRVVIKQDEEGGLSAYVYDGSDGTVEQGYENFRNGYGNYSSEVLDNANRLGWRTRDYRSP